MNINSRKKRKCDWMAIFTGKIYCGNCERMYKRKNDRGKNKWICQGFESLSICAENILSEDAMIEFISRRLFVTDRTLDAVTKFINDHVERIVVKDINDFHVIINGQQHMFMKPGHIHY